MTCMRKHFGIYALIFNDKCTEVLLVKKARGPYIGMLDLPGGSPEIDETPQETLRREVQEEVGGDILSATDIGHFETSFKYTKDHLSHVLCHRGDVFLTVLQNVADLGIKSTDTDGCVWIPKDKVIEARATPPVCSALELYNGTSQGNRVI